MEDWRKEIHDHNQAIVDNIEKAVYSSESLIKDKQEVDDLEKAVKRQEALDTLEKGVEAGLISEQTFTSIRDGKGEDSQDLFTGFQYGE